MTLIDNHVSDLLVGYNIIRQAEIELRRKWESRLHAVAAQRQQAYDVAENAYLQQRRRAIKKASLVLIVAAVIAIGLFTLSNALPENQLGLSLLACCCVPLTGGLIALGLIGTVLRQRPKESQYALRTDAVLSLRSRWWDELSRELAAPENDGAIGEHQFVREMQRHLSADYVIAHGLQQNFGEDVDVVIVGPKGVWVFEVKYWSGTIFWRNGEWRREKTYYQPGGQQVTELERISQPPDEQQQRVAADVKKTLQLHAPQLAERFPKAVLAGGGLAFTHRDATYRIDQGLPVSWGTTRGWIKHLVQAPEIPGWQATDTLIALEELLTRHQQINAIQPRSMKAFAGQLIYQAKKKAKSLVATQHNQI